MKQLQIKRTKQTPEINCNAETGELSFLGRSLPEDSASFYQVVFDWLNEYIQELPSSTKVKFELDYFNTSSAKAIFSLILKFENLFKQNHSITIDWLYDEDDEDMRDLGKEYQDLFKMPIRLIEKTNE